MKRKSLQETLSKGEDMDHGFVGGKVRKAEKYFEVSQMNDSAFKQC